MAGTKTCLCRFCFKSELLFIKFAVSGFKSSVDSRKLCNLDSQISLKSIQSLLFQSNSPYIAPNLRIMSQTTYQDLGRGFNEMLYHVRTQKYYHFLAVFKDLCTILNDQYQLKWFLKCHKVADDSQNFLAILRGGGNYPPPWLHCCSISVVIRIFL